MVDEDLNEYESVPVHVMIAQLTERVGVYVFISFKLFFIGVLAEVLVFEQVHR